MTPSPACVALIKSFEGCELSAFQDVAGVWTIGYGTTGPGIVEGLTWTQEQADAALIDRANQAGQAVTLLVTVPLTQSRFDALTDFVYNLGAGSLQTSTLLRLLNQGQYTAVPPQLYRDVDGVQAGWIYADGQIQPGLIRRRQAEQALWNS